MSLAKEFTAIALYVEFIAMALCPDVAFTKSIVFAGSVSVSSSMNVSYDLKTAECVQIPVEAADIVRKKEIF